MSLLIYTNIFYSIILFPRQTKQKKTAASGDLHIYFLSSTLAANPLAAIRRLVRTRAEEKTSWRGSESQRQL